MSVLGNSTATIRDLNDAFRKNFACGKVVMTSSLACEPDEKRMATKRNLIDHPPARIASFPLSVI